MIERKDMKNHDRRWNSVFDFLKDQGLSLFSLGLVLALAAGAFALSYAGLKDLASTNGVDPRLVWIWPLVLDGAIVVFSVCAFRAGLCGESVTYPMFLVVLSTIASIAFNVLHAPIPEGAYFWSREALVPRIMASIPPLCLFLSFEVMIRQLKSQVKISSAFATENKPDAAKDPAAGTEGADHHAMAERFGEMFGNPAQSDGEHGAVVTPFSDPEPAYSAKAPKMEPPTKVVPQKQPKKKKKTAAEAKSIVIAMCKEGALLNEMAEAANRSPQTVARYLREADLGVPMKGPPIGSKQEAS